MRTTQGPSVTQGPPVSHYGGYFPAVPKHTYGRKTFLSRRLTVQTHASAVVPRGCRGPTCRGPTSHVPRCVVWLLLGRSSATRRLRAPR